MCIAWVLQHGETRAGSLPLPAALLAAAAAALGALLLFKVLPGRRRARQEQQGEQQQQARFEALIQRLNLEPTEPAGPLAGCSAVISSLWVAPLQ
jgi:hypothetical protein